MRTEKEYNLWRIFGITFALLKVGNSNNRGNAMRCFFHGRNRKDDGMSGFNALVSFAIPDIGISFRAQFKGSQEECEYASLLALLEFVELNPHLFKNKRIEIFGNDYRVINKINRGSQPSRELDPYLNMAVGYKSKIPFTLNWIPDDENLAQDIIFPGQG